TTVSDANAPATLAGSGLGRALLALPTSKSMKIPPMILPGRAGCLSTDGGGILVDIASSKITVKCEPSQGDVVIIVVTFERESKSKGMPRRSSRITILTVRL